MTSEQNTQMQQNAFTLVMGLPHNTKIAKTLSIFVTTTLIIALRQKAHVMAYRVLSRGLLPVEASDDFWSSDFHSLQNVSMVPR